MIPAVLAAIALSLPGQPRITAPVASVFDDAWRHHVRHERVVARWRHVRAVREARRRRFRRLAVVRVSRAQRAVRAALSQVGVPYVWGGESPGIGFDCSGLIQWAYRTVGVSLPRTTWGMASSGYEVPLAAIQPGDIVEAYGLEHVVLYVGSGMVVEAPHSGLSVGEAPLSWFPIDEVRRVA